MSTTTPTDESVAEPPLERSDGRTARATRTRQSIVDALLGLLEEGELQPTATQIASRAGISLRLIYHHFGDLESLFRATADRQTERAASLVQPIDPALGVNERIAAFCEQRGRMLEWLTPVRRAAILHEPFSPELRRARDRFMDRSKAEVVRLFDAELAHADEDERQERLAAVAATSSWGFWDTLRSTGHDVDEAVGVLRRAVTALLGVDAETH
ncbi:MAG: TetR/AcrR family transcriptional regulator [Acidimicrobiia bacterium]|nr:TetR/AcrR family transcriptional regulator [Acidimicrobiia bacterium]